MPSAMPTPIKRSHCQQRQQFARRSRRLRLRGAQQRYPGSFRFIGVAQQRFLLPIQMACNRTYVSRVTSIIYELIQSCVAANIYPRLPIIQRGELQCNRIPESLPVYARNSPYYTCLWTLRFNRTAGDRLNRFQTHCKRCFKRYSNVQLSLYAASLLYLHNSRTQFIRNRHGLCLLWLIAVFRDEHLRCRRREPRGVTRKIARQVP